MNFLFPTLLAFGVLAIIPFIIHLFGERKYKPMTFSSLKFLKEIERESMQKFHLRQWLILILRALWILFIVLVLAQPFFKKAGGGLDPGLIVLDESLSTQIDPNYKQLSNQLHEHFKSWKILSFNERSMTDSLMMSIKKYCDNTKGADNIIFITDAQDNKQNLEIFSRIKELDETLYVLPLTKDKENTAIMSFDEKINSQIDNDLRYLQILLSGRKNSQNLSAYIYVNSKRVGRAYADDTNFADYYLSAEEKGDLLCIAQCPEDDYPEDNKYYLLLSDFRNIKVLFVDYPESPSYASKALEALEDIQVSKISPELLATQDLNNYDLIWLNGFFDISKSLQKSLLEYADKQTLLISPPSKIIGKNIWEEQSGKLIASEKVDGYILFRDLNNPNGQEKYIVNRYYKTSIKTDKPIWELDSGEPLLFKNGVYVLLSPLHFEWNEIGLSPYFLQSISRFIQNSLGNTKENYEIGDIIPLSGTFTRVTTPNGEHINASDYFDKTQTPGFYYFENDEKNWILAVNFPSEESEQGLMEISKDEELSVETTDLSSIDRQINGRKGQTLFFVLALLCLMLEMMLIHKGESTK